MQKQDRILYLENLTQEFPNDPFGWYALHLEKINESPDGGISGWEEILARFPDYLPLYYQFGMAFLSQKKTEKAIEIFSRGIQLAEKQQDLHALTELKSARMNAMIDE